MATEITAKGDLIVGTGNATFDNLPVGTNGYTLVADSSVSPTGLKWAAPASGSTFAGCSLKSSTSSLAVANATTTVLTWDQEYFDSDAYHSTSSNTSRITIPSGKGGYYLFVHNQLAGNPVASKGYNYRLYKNGAEVRYIETQSGALTTGYMYWTQTWIIDGAVGDYFEVYVTQNSGGSVNYFFDGLAAGLSNFSCTYLGA